MTCRCTNHQWLIYFLWQTCTNKTQKIKLSQLITCSFQKWILKYIFFCKDVAKTTQLGQCKNTELLLIDKYFISNTPHVATPDKEHVTFHDRSGLRVERTWDECSMLWITALDGLAITTCMSWTSHTSP